MSRRIVLVVDDHAVLRGLLKSLLRRWFPGVGVVEALDGETAVSLAAEMRPDVVIMDITLPGMNGIEATRLLKAGLPNTSVIMLSVHELDAYRRDAIAAGADAYISKRHIHSALQGSLARILASPLGSPMKREANT